MSRLSDSARLVSLINELPDKMALDVSNAGRDMRGDLGTITVKSHILIERKLYYVFHIPIASTNPTQYQNAIDLLVVEGYQRCDPSPHLEITSI